VYLVDGFSRRIPLTSFDPAYEAGYDSLTWVEDGALDGYATSPAPLGYAVTCNGVKYVSASGSLHEVSAALAPLYPLATTELDARTCAQTVVGKAATQFIRLANGSIFQLVGGQKRPVTSMDRYTELGGPTVGYLDVSQGLASAIPLGPNA
jgi:hypothetical protein